MMSAMSSAGSIRGKKSTPPPTDFVFQIKGGASVPTETTAGTGYSTTYPISNIGTVITTATVGTRTNAITLSGANYLQIPVPLPISFTRTLWLSSTTPTSNNGVAYSSGSNVLWFRGGDVLQAYANWGAGWTTTPFLTVQTSTWIFYAMTQTGTKISVYVNGLLVNTLNGTNWLGDSGNTQLGAYAGVQNYTGFMDDARLYTRELSAAEIQALYAAG